MPTTWRSSRYKERSANASETALRFAQGRDEYNLSVQEFSEHEEAGYGICKMAERRSNAMAVLRSSLAPRRIQGAQPVR